MNHLLHSTNLFECYCWQNYTTVSNTDLYLSYFDLSYVFPGHYDSVQRGLTLIQIWLLVGFFSSPFFAWIINHTSMHVPIMIPININALRALKKRIKYWWVHRVCYNDLYYSHEYFVFTSKDNLFVFHIIVKGSSH